MSESLRLLDSSVWIEIFGGGALAKVCQKELSGADRIFVPTLVLFEVYRKIAQSVSEDQALSAVAVMAQNTVVDLSQDVALTAADISLAHRLGMADSMVLAHAKNAGALLITLDNDFHGMSGVKVLRA